MLLKYYSLNIEPNVVKSLPVANKYVCNPHKHRTFQSHFITQSRFKLPNHGNLKADFLISPIPLFFSIVRTPQIIVLNMYSEIQP